MPDSNENPYVFHPLTYWALAILCLIAPLLFLGTTLPAAIPIAVCWLIALAAFAAGLGSLRWRGENEGRSCPFHN